MTENPIITALLLIPPRPLPGVELLAGLYESGPATVDELLEVGPEIEAQINEANSLGYRTSQAVARCLKLQPVSAPRPLAGF